MPIQGDINQVMSNQERMRREAQNIGLGGVSSTALANALRPANPASLREEVERAEGLSGRIMQSVRGLEDIISRLDGVEPLEGAGKAPQAEPMGYVARLGEANRSSARCLDRLEDQVMQLSRILSGVNNG